MNNEAYFADLHIHIGRTQMGRPVKITGAQSLTLENILKAAKKPKGLDIVGVIDCHSPEVREEIRTLIGSGGLAPLKGGGLLYQGKVTLIPGVEIEVYDENCLGPVHVLAYFPELAALDAFSGWYAARVANPHLSTQRIRAGAKELQQKVKALDGMFIPAHVFTPFKSLYGKGVERSLEEVLDPDLIDAVELGLSSDTDMADRIGELHRYPFVTNSDAHSLAKIAREYQMVALESPSFNALLKAFRNEGGNRIIANYGLNPKLGKYYTTTCAKCRQPVSSGICPHCGSPLKTKGVSGRIEELADAQPLNTRPPYIHQVPLEFLPGLGPKTMAKLLDHFGTEMDILHRVPEEALREVVNLSLSDLIVKARAGMLALDSGGGGKYGKVKQKKPR
ncbi:hypothetical protein BpJC7_05800 [Weizmannia acidilactici]|uniref:TIGR00375 family protein n=1 Tax=Weizmannia acidilactici TaxID=2607726 RepID=A0A5J4JFH2_9BACI|nr:endonuclease Q family protein [Weizmannia acidilactici]GER66088.1 hypothetical protein BpJC4_05590 [Weizmannia acidilactici]GER69277.1 hypothetical protein BpJC7_05800 [Weizmannia acidilactici]GER72397.1 hypothetical protein BpPP18_04640 [Weizmannia acidilactici]